MYDIVPGVFNIVNYGTPCNQDSIHVTVPFSFVQGYKTSKRKLSRTPLIVPRIIELSKDANPHLDQRVAPLTVITTDVVVP